jgi:hypothetical protein
MRDIETIDAELRLVARAWRIAHVVSDQMPSTELIDQLAGRASSRRTTAGQPRRGLQSARWTGPDPLARNGVQSWRAASWASCTREVSPSLV